MHGPASQVQSVDRALTVLEILARYGELGVTEIAAQLDVHKSTAFRLVGALEQHRLVEQLGERGKYRLGFGIVRLAGATTARLELARESRPVCRRLAADINETVNVAIMDAGAAVNISQEQGSATITVHNWIGQRTPLHATSSGKALLAWADADALAAVLEAGLERHTPDTITEPAVLRAELDRIRQHGWAGAAEELETGLNAVAAPIRGADGSVVAAVSASGPSYRLGRESFPEIAKKLQAGADEISSQLGYYRAHEAPPTALPERPGGCRADSPPSASATREAGPAGSARHTGGPLTRIWPGGTLLRISRYVSYSALEVAWLDRASPLSAQGLSAQPWPTNSRPVAGMTSPSWTRDRCRNQAGPPLTPRGWCSRPTRRRR
jgi:DNA-binding IclR family transcriptional regulator